MAPYVIGQWVRGERFYGRRALIEEILHGPRDAIWLLGLRRSGKTSVLRQAEMLSCRADPPGYFSLYWNLEGAETPDELTSGLGDALTDAAERLDARGIRAHDLESLDVFATLRRLRRQLAPQGLRPLLLCDEAEALIGLHRHDPSIVRKMRKALQGDGIRSVLASTLRLWDLAGQREDTSPFLHGFLPPLYLRNLDPDESRALIRQTNSPSDSRPPYDPETVERIRRHCDDHPYLLQLVCRRLLESGDLERAVEQVATDPMVSQFFATDFEQLGDVEQRIIKLIGRRTTSTSETIQATIPLEDDQLRGLLQRLDALGYIRRTSAQGYELVNSFFRRWFADKPGTDPGSDRIPGRSHPEPAASGTSSTSSGHLPPVPAVRGNALAAQLRELLFSPDDDAGFPALGLFDQRYELLEKIGEGAAGAVFRARDEVLRTVVAVKVLRSSVAADPAALERFRREVALSREIAHPHLLRLHHLGECGTRSYLTMRWVDGPSLARILERDGPLDEEPARVLFAKLVSAVGALHDRGVIHRDIKPANILVERQTGEPFLCDFGLARQKDLPGVTDSGLFVGTPQYAAPEQIRSGSADERSDIFSLGRVLQEALGERGLASSLGTLARECVHESPAERPPTCAAILDALRPA